MIWIGEVVTYRGKKATVVDIDLPMVCLHIGGSKMITVRWDAIKKIRDSHNLINPRNN